MLNINNVRLQTLYPRKIIHHIYACLENHEQLARKWKRKGKRKGEGEGEGEEGRGRES